MKNLKIISLNCSIKNKDNFEDISKFLDVQNPDIVVLQEVNLTGGDFSQKINFAMEVPFPFAKTEFVETYTTSSGETYSQGQSVLSKFNFRSSKKDLSKVPEDKHNRIFQIAEFNFGQENLKIANVHFAPKNNNLTQLEEVILANPDIIVGDFNIRGRDLEDFLADQSGFRAACETLDYVSFPGSKEFFQIDHCLISEKFHFEKVDIFEGLSDHNALILEIGEKK